jgi:hypothetical protein
MPRGRHVAPSKVAALGALIVAAVTSAQGKPKTENRGGMK